ncbi:MAG: sterol desaturase family protein [Pseudomonadota bacterium]
MPSLFELLQDPIAQSVIGIYLALIGLEALFPGRPLPAVKGWRLRGLAAFVVYFLLSSYLPLLWTEWLLQWQWFDLTELNTAAGVVAGLLVYEAGAYVWHRSMHRFNVLWRGLHQMHHSAERLDAYSAFWFSPLDMVGWTALTSLCLTVIVGLSAEASTITLLILTLLAVFQHTNLRTPQWLGYLVQRPESHSHHHARGVHNANYADLPVFDLLFGTFNNPADFADATGFYDGASKRIGDMLRFRDVSEPTTR